MEHDVKVWSDPHRMEQTLATSDRDTNTTPQTEARDPELKGALDAGSNKPARGQAKQK